MANGIFPEQLKITKITPILKSGKAETYSNYRLIAIVPVLDKVFEKAVNNQLMEYLKVNKLLHKRQYGYIDLSNANTTLFDYITEVQTNIDSKKKLDLFFSI